ncbi:MAG: hypothetical protein M1830_008604 [Pleopsidium flavum]|nr:MAG: hypothetical protein M1830_008604 [Pleopsidium flavum]
MIHYFAEQSILLHPVALVFYQLTIIAVFVGFTTPSSIIRYAALPPLVACAWVVILTCLEKLQNIVWAGILANYSACLVLQYFEKVLLRRWSFEDFGAISKATRSYDAEKRKIPSSKARDGLSKDRAGGILERLYFGYFIATSYRNPGTPYQVKNVPLFSDRDPSYVPSRAEFLRQKVMIFVLCYLVLDLATLGTQPETHPVRYSPRKVPFLTRLGEVSREEFIVRGSTTFGFWFSLYCSLQIYTNIIPFIIVASGLGEVRSWRPSFGPLREAYTLRHLWGVFWHQFNRQRLSEPSSFATTKVLNLSKTTMLGRYTHLILAFLLSGFMHALTDVAEDYGWQASGSIRYFVTQAVGILLEDCVQAIYRSARGMAKEQQPELWAKLVGYLWVLLFQFWSTPAWIYPALIMNKGEKKDMIVPYSFFTHVKS